SERSPITLPDNSDKSVFGASQKSWFKQGNIINCFFVPVSQNAELLNSMNNSAIFWINTFLYIEDASSVAIRFCLVLFVFLVTGLQVGSVCNRKKRTFYFYCSEQFGQQNLHHLWRCSHGSYLLPFFPVTLLTTIRWHSMMELTTHTKTGEEKAFQS